jgi:hypothetical protein
MLGELERLSKLQPDSETYRVELAKIRKAKLGYIKFVLDDLFTVVKAYIGYKKAKEDDFAPFMEFMKRTNHELFRDVGNFPAIETKGPPNIKESYSGAILAMVPLDFVPPGNMGILTLLWALWHYHNETFNYPPTLVDMRLDLSLIKLIRASSLMKKHFEQIGTRELGRIKQSIKKVAAISEEKKTYVIEIYHRDRQIKSGMKLNKVIRIIKKHFEEIQGKGTEFAGIGKIPMGIKSPSPDQIKRYLVTEGIVNKDFMKEGRFWVMQR